MTFRLAVAVLALGVLSACNKKCDATTCATGCCDAAGACVSTPTATACGASGAQCMVCAIGQSCQAGFCTPNGVTGGGGGSGGGVGGGSGGGAGGGGGTNVTFQQLLRDVYTAYCGYMARCGAMAATDVATCADLYANSGGFGGFTTSEQVANVGFTGDYTQCIADLGTVSCEAGSSGPSSCRSSPQPRGFVATGGACVISSVECADALDACSATCPRTCQRLAQGGNGQTCRRTGTTSCDTGLFCNAALICQAKGAAGATCNGGDECQSGTCSSQVCVALPSAGQACRAGFPYCDATSWCNASDLCVASKGDGASCSYYDNECLPPLGCNGGTCRPRGGVGTPCTSFSDCSGDLGCDQLLRTCQEYTDVATGQPCTSSTRNCASRDERCLGVAVNPDGGVGTLGTCAAPVIGTACASPSDCPLHATCDVGGHCVASTTGGSCSSARNCLVGDYCNAANTCTPRFATNAQCDATSSSSSCLMVTDVCTATPTDAVRRCRPRGAIGAPCINASACSAVLACVNGACAAAGHPGQPCFGGSACVGGVCGADGGCQGAGALDAGCYDYSHCQSGACRDRHCVGSLCP